MGGQRHAPAALSPGKTRYPLYRRLGGPQGRSGRVRNISSSPGFDPRTTQPAASRYTDWAIPIYDKYRIYKYIQVLGVTNCDILKTIFVCEVTVRRCVDGSPSSERPVLRGFEDKGTTINNYVCTKRYSVIFQQFECLLCGCANCQPCCPLYLITFQPKCLSIWEFLVSNTCPDASYPDSGILWVFSVPPCEC